MKIKNAFLFGLVLLMVSFATVQPSLAQKPCGPTVLPMRTLFVNWPQFHYDAAHTGCNPYESILGPSTVGNLALDWTYSDSQQGTYTSPAIANGVLYVGMGGGSFNNPYGYAYALNASTGALLWRYQATDRVVSPPAVANGIVYFTTALPGTLFALDAGTGAFLWSRYTGGYKPPTVANGVVYAPGYGGAYGIVYALDGKTGNVLWQYHTVGVNVASPAVANGVVYVGTDDDNLYALNATTGALLWKYATGGEVQSSPAVVSGKVYFGSQDHNLYALDAATGSLVWTYKTGANVDSSPAVADGVVYVGTSTSSYPPDYNLYALNATTGARLWKYTALDSVQSSPAVANGVVYFFDYDNYFWAVDAVSGTLLWYQAGYQSDTAVIANGAVYVGGDYVYAFHLPGH